jgi:apolipoprotein N-acyltransferase
VTPGGEASPAATPAARILARGLLLPAVAGAACVLGFAPFYAWPVPIFALAALFAVWERSASALQATLSGYAFGLGFFLIGVSWVYVSLHFYGAMPVVLAAIATFLFCATLALAPALAGWIVVRVGGGDPWARLLAAPAAFMAGEWIRSWILTGFPWITLGTSQVPSSPLAGFVPLVGAYGVSLAVAAAAALLVALMRSFALSRARFALVGALAALFLAGGALRHVEWTEPAGAPLSMALLQGNVPQGIKWADEMRLKTLFDYRRMIFAANARVVVLPETALPVFLDELPPEYLESLREHARQTGKEILLGTVERDGTGASANYYNSVVRLTGTGPASYRKRHLVPFGEFIPSGFSWLYAFLKIPMGDMAHGAAHQPPVEAGGTRFGVAICYEDLFGEEMIDFLPDAQVLLNVSNMAWFGDSLAPGQHLQASQTRALETGRWMVRATNTGVTAAIDEKGRVVARLPGFTEATLVTAVTPRQGMTPYARWGNAAALVLMAALGLGAARARRTARRKARQAPPG